MIRTMVVVFEWTDDHQDLHPFPTRRSYDLTVWRGGVEANVAADPARRFEIDPGALIAALRAERGGGETVIGYWHSHPSGDATPSATDAAMAAADGKIWLIVAGGTVTAWRAGATGVHGRFERLAVDAA